MFKEINKITFVASTGLFLITLYVATQCRYPEIDEIYFMDAPANLLLNGEWKSHILWGQFLYQPLHAFLLIPWMFVFGISHFSVCGFGVFLGYVTSLLLVKYAKQLNYIDEIWQEILIVIGFWAFNTFTDYETFGRPDNLGMLITVYVIRQLLIDSISFRKLVFLGVLLVLTGIYEIPVIIFFFVFMIFFNWRNRSIITEWIKKGLYLAAGVLIGELCVISFFFVNEGTSVIRYITYTFFGMNGNAQSSLMIIKRMIEAYSENGYITVIFVLFLIIITIKKISYNKSLAIFIIILPALMVLAGRFCTYYLWIYYIPITIFVVYTLHSQKHYAIFAILLFSFAGILFFASQWNIKYGHQTGTISELEKIKKDCHCFFIKHKDLIKQYHNVVLSEEQLYYDVVNANSEVWFQYKKNIAHKLDFYNYEAMDKILHPLPHKKLGKYMTHPIWGQPISYLFEMNPPLPIYPENGLCIYTCELEKTTSLKFMKHFGYKYECIGHDGPFSLYKFSK